MNGTAEVAVVGGGIAGTTLAFELARRGTRVTLFEQANLGAGASGRNTGTLLHQTEPAVSAMLRESLAAYRELGVELHERVQLLVARDEQQLLATARRVDAMDGVEAERVTGDQLRAELPAINREVAGGYALAGAHTVDAETATRAFAEAAREAGATIATGVRVGALEPGGLVTDVGRVAADLVVLATGPWLGDLLPHAPLRAGRGWLLRTARLPFALPWILEEDSWPDQDVLGRAAAPIPLGELAQGAGERPVARAVLLCPLPGGDALLGASLSTSLRDAVEGAAVPRELAARALELAPGLADTVAITRAWSGLRPLTPDGLPLVGPTATGLHVHGGHASLGMQAAPATARWLAAHLHGEATHPTLEELWPERFQTA